MNDIDRWFDRAARRENRTVSLYASLMTGRIFKYFAYRLRYALLIDATRFVIHVAEFLIILTSLGGPVAFTVMILRMGSLIVSGAWWGLLEVMRERLRTLTVSRDRDAIEREIGSWLLLSMTAMVLLIIGGAAVLASLLPAGHDAVGLFYAFLVVIELAVRLPVRVLHSGIFATRRIYRPLRSMFAPTVVQLVVIGVGALLYPTAAIIVAIIASNALSIWITVHYTVRAYRLSGLWPKYRTGSVRQWFPAIPVRLGLQTTLAGLGLRLDAVLVLAIVGIYGTNTRAFDLTAGFAAWRDVDAFQFFYLVLPLFRGAYDATSVFYFDFVRLRRIPTFRQFRVSFFHRVVWMTPVLALFFWSLAAALGLFVLPDVPASFLLALLPLFVVRSTIGAYQIRMFAEGQFRMLIATIALLAALLALVWIDVNPASDLIQITAAMVAILIVHINLQHFQDRTTVYPTLLSLRDWTDRLGREPGPVRVGEVTIPEWIDSRQRTAAVELIRESIDGRGHFACRSATALIFYERGADDSSAPAPHVALQTATGGAANRARLMPQILADGRQALDRLAAERWLPGVHDVTPDTLRTSFLSLFPDGVVIDMTVPARARDVDGLDEGLLAAVLSTSMRSLNQGVAVLQVADRWVTPLFEHARLGLVFVLPPEPDADRLRQWRRVVRDWSSGRFEVEGAVHAHTG